MKNFLQGHSREFRQQLESSLPLLTLPSPWLLCTWEGGSASFKRKDEVI